MSFAYLLLKNKAHKQYPSSGTIVVDQRHFPIASLNDLDTFSKEA